MSAVLPRSFWVDLASGLFRGVRRRRLAISVVVAATLTIILGFRLVRGSQRASDFVVRRGTLEPTVPFVGSLAPLRSDTYGATVPGVELKILWLVEEGLVVNPGDRLVQFDSAPFERDLETARARVRELSGEDQGARLAVDALRLKSDVEVREKSGAAELSERELNALVNTTAPLTAQESQNDIDQRERTLLETEAKVTGLEPFVADGYISQEEYRAAEGRRNQAAADLRLAKSRHNALVRQATPDLIRRKSQEMENGRMVATLSASKARLELAQAEAAASVSTARLAEAARQVGEADKRIAACTVVAKASGLAVHSETFDKGGQRRKVRVGDSVWGGTTVVALPDLSAMLVEGHVPESEIHLLSPGQTVTIKLDAFPVLGLTGKLRSVGAVTSSAGNNSRSFPVSVALDRTDPRFRPGMTARCSVQGEPLKNALFVPLEAVRSTNKGDVVMVVSHLGRISARPIATGISTSQLVQVRYGLSEGDVVRVSNR